MLYETPLSEARRRHAGEVGTAGERPRNTARVCHQGRCPTWQKSVQEASSGVLIMLGVSSRKISCFKAWQIREGCIYYSVFPMCLAVCYYLD